MKNEITFSIVIPTYNRAELITDTLQTVFQQTYPRYEVIVVDDGSTDDTENLVRNIRHENLRYFKKENAERAAARNFGIKQAAGQYITFLDSDDVLYPFALEHAARVIAEMNYPPFLHLGYEVGTEKKISARINHLRDNDPMILRDGNPLSCLGVFIKKEITGSFLFNEDRRLTGSEDWEYWLRLAAHFGLRTDNRIIGRLTEHDARSVLNVTEEQLVNRKELSLQYAFSDAAVQKIYSASRKRMEAFWNIYIALHLALSRKKMRAIRYLTVAFGNFPAVIFSRRFYSTLLKIMI